MVAIPAASPPRWIHVEDSASALIRYTGPWSLANTRSGGSNRRSGGEISANADTPARWIDSNGSLSVDFAGYEASLIGGMTFMPSSTDFAFCTVDGIVVPLSATGVQDLIDGTAPLCHVTGLSDGPHVLTLNVTNTGSATSETDASKNRLWIDSFSYATSRWTLAARQAPSSSTTGSSIPIPSTTIAPTGANNGTNANNNNNNNNGTTSSKTATRIGAIAGGIIGGALLVVFLRGVFFFVQRNDGTRTAVGRPPSPTYESGWTLPKLGKSGGPKGGDLKKDEEEAEGVQKGAVGGAHTPDGVPLSPLKEDNGKASPVATYEHASQAPERDSHTAAV